MNTTLTSKQRISFTTCNEQSKNTTEFGVFSPFDKVIWCYLTANYHIQAVLIFKMFNIKKGMKTAK